MGAAIIGASTDPERITKQVRQLSVPILFQKIDKGPMNLRLQSTIFLDPCPIFKKNIYR
jgi:hypothetical protein